MIRTELWLTLAMLGLLACSARPVPAPATTGGAPSSSAAGSLSSASSGGSSGGRSTAAGSTGRATGGSASGTASGASGTSGSAASSGGAGSSTTGGRSSGGTAAGGSGTSGGSSSGTPGGGTAAGTGSGGTIGTASGGQTDAGPPDVWCFDGGAAPACPGGTSCVLDGGGMGVCCLGACADLSSDPQNCGGCGLPCPNGATACVNGWCAYPTCAGAPPGFLAACLTGAIDCPFSPMLPPNSWPLYYPYTQYGCVLQDGGWGVCCGGGCQDRGYFASDPQNCGDCGIGLTAGALCSNGLAAATGIDAGCPAGTTWMYGNTSCVALNCGADGTACWLGDGGGVCCGGACRDFLADAQHCGGCFACAAGQVCDRGYCRTAVDCTAGPPFLNDFGMAGAACALDGGGPGRCCNGACIDEQSDALNCGACGLACGAGATCVLGRCAWANLTHASCAADGGCPAGLLCDPGDGVCLPQACPASSEGDGQSCALPCSDPSYCPTIGVCCGGQCTDVLGNAGSSATCGGCGPEFACGCGLSCFFDTCH